MESYLGKCSCIYCHDVRSARGIHTHVDRTHLGSTKYSSGYNGKYDDLSERAKIKLAENIRKYEENPQHCLRCKTSLSYNNRKNKFCNRSCSASYENDRRKNTGWSLSLDVRTKISEKLSGIVYSPPIEITIICKTCNSPFSFIKHYTKKEKHFCSRKCRMSNRNLKARENRDAFLNYRADCAFKFALNDYPSEFDFSLVEQHGWYKAKNRGNNLYGVSRDHMVSVKYGFDNNIDPVIISHPANCRLVLHSENASKNSKNHITYEELLIRIRNWDSKYKK